MLTLNLISQELRQEIKSRHIYSLLKKINYILVIVSIIIAIILLTAKIILSNNFNNVVAQTTLVANNSKGYTDKVRGINYKINSAAQIQNDNIEWTYLIEHIAQNIPENTSITLVKIDKNKGIINISGLADTRDSYLKIKDNFIHSKIFDNVESPIKNLLLKEDIRFEFIMKLNLENYSSLF